MHRPTCFQPTLLVIALGAVAAGCGTDTTPPNAKPSDQHNMAMSHTLFVAHQDSLASYDLTTGEERPGEVQNIDGPTDLQALEDGTLLVNLTNRNEILIVDGHTMLEKARMPSSAKGATRPVHSYLSPTHADKRYWLSMNDGEDDKLETNSARFVDTAKGSATYLKPVGEVNLGKGHHKAAFSAKSERVVISNIADCDDVISVFDYSNIADIKKLATLSAKDAGWDGSEFKKICDQTYTMGVPPAPHGCATAKSSNRAYCNLTGNGSIVSVDIDADPPAFHVITTTGAGAGYTKAHPDGRYIYALQGEPREGGKDNPGASCQVGQLVVIDAENDTVVKEMPLLYKGPACKDLLVGTDEASAEPSHIQVSLDGKRLFIAMAGAFGDANARVRQEMVVDISDPAAPAQLASIAVGASTSYRGDALSGDGKLLFLADNIDNTVSVISTADSKVLRTLKVKANPLTLATFGDKEGPSEQTGPIL